LLPISAVAASLTEMWSSAERVNDTDGVQPAIAKGGGGTLNSVNLARERYFGMLLMTVRN
jgi:hypothetical protein